MLPYIINIFKKITLLENGKYNFRRKQIHFDAEETL